MSDLVERLRRWADARERRNTPGGHGKAGTALLREAADALASVPERDTLREENAKLREVLRDIELIADGEVRLGPAAAEPYFRVIRDHARAALAAPVEPREPSRVEIAERRVLSAVENDWRHGNLTGRTEDAWHELQSARAAVEPREEQA